MLSKEQAGKLLVKFRHGEKPSSDDIYNFREEVNDAIKERVAKARNGILFLIWLCSFSFIYVSLVTVTESTEIPLMHHPDGAFFTALWIGHHPWAAAFTFFTSAITFLIVLFAKLKQD